MVRLFKTLSRYRAKLFWMLLFLFLQVLGTLFIPTLTADIVNIGIVQGDIDYIWRTGLMMLGIAVLTAAAAIMTTYLSSDLAAILGRNVRNDLFRKVQSFPVSTFQQFGTASMITRNTNDVMTIQQSFISLSVMFLPAPIIAVAGLILAFSKDRVIATGIVLAMIIILLLTVMIGRKAIPIFEAMQTMLDKINRVVRENITGIRVIRAFHKTAYEKKRMNQTFEEYASMAIKANKIFALLMPMIMMIVNFGIVAIIWYGGIKVANGYLQIGDIMALIEYASMILMYMVMAVMVVMIIPRAEICAQRILAVLNTPVEKEENLAEAPKLYSSPTLLNFQNVTFRYQGAEESVLRDLTFYAKQNQTLAIIGGTGSGKSTIASLIPRFYEIQKGQILVGGMDARDYTLQELRERIGYVQQKPFLFSGTIADNLRQGNPNASEEEMHHALKIAQIDDFVVGLPDGLQSHVAQGGSNFSGGQKQRLSIARTLMKKPDIYIFDDSFSVLDVQTDARLRAALKQETKHALVVLVAQRISTIMDADRIIVLEDGQIVGNGRHEELMETCPVYQQIAQSQLSQKEESQDGR